MIIGANRSKHARYDCAVALDPGDPLAALRNEPAMAGVFTTSTERSRPSCRDPAAAKPVRGVAELLDGLAQRYGVVAVVSGRPVAFLAALLPASVVLSGLSGLEVQRDGERRVDPGVERWRAVVARAVTRCQAEAPPGVMVEAKGLSLTLHYRTDQGLASQVQALAREVAGASGLVVRVARMSWSCNRRSPLTRVSSSDRSPRTFVLCAIWVMTSAI